MDGEGVTVDRDGPVTVDRDGPVTVVSIDRPHVRNAVDATASAQLRDRLIGHSRAMDLVLTGRSVVGPEALAMGLVNRLVPPGRALEGARRFAAGAGRSGAPLPPSRSAAP